jgi:hypothetical protein
MQTTRESLVTALLTLSVCTSAALGGAPMGLPIATLEEGKWSLGGEFGHEQIDLEASGKSTERWPTFSLSQRQKFEIEDLTSNMLFGNVAYGICNNWDVFIRVGAADAADDIVISGVGQDSFDGSYGFAWGIGTRATFGRRGPWTFGGQVQVTWFRPGDSDFAIIDPLIPDETWSGKVELEYWQAQVGLAAVYQVDAWRLWAGPFLQFIDGDMDFKGQAIITEEPGSLTWTSDVEESSQFGAHVGASWDMTEQWNLWVEGQLTGDSWLIGIGTAFTPETFGL